MYDPRSLRPGDVILVAGVHWTHGLAAGLLDAAIQWATVSPFHHAALVGEGANSVPVHRPDGAARHL